MLRHVEIIARDSRVHTDRRTRAIPAAILVVTRAAVTYSIRRRRRPSSVRPDDARLVDATTSTRPRWVDFDRRRRGCVVVARRNVVHSL